MRFCAMSDLHGQLPIHLPECDVVLLAGDICDHGKAEFQLAWMDRKLRKWLEKINKPVFACSGNHDWPMWSKLKEVRNLKLPWTYLQDEATVFNGWKIYGTPWQKKFFNWAFNLDESQLMGKWNLIPDDTDVLICHGPPKYYGDRNPRGELCGSESLTWRIGQLENLRLVCYGHIHAGYGVYSSKNTILANVSLLDERYKLVNKPFIVELEK